MARPASRHRFTVTEISARWPSHLAGPVAPRSWPPSGGPASRRASTLGARRPACGRPRRQDCRLVRVTEPPAHHAESRSCSA